MVKVAISEGLREHEARGGVASTARSGQGCHTRASSDDKTTMRHSMIAGVLAGVVVVGCQQQAVGRGEGRTVSLAHTGTPREGTVQEKMPMLSATASSEPLPVGSSAAVDTQAQDPGLASKEVVRRAKEELGERVHTKEVTGRFILVGERSTVESGAPFVERVVNALMNGRFERGLSRPIAVYLFPDVRSYQGYCQKQWGEGCISQYGFFEPTQYKLVMNIGLGIGTLSHEMVHPIMGEDFPDAPTWLNEGIASLFEAPVLPRTGEIHGVRNWRYPRLMAALGSGRERGKASLQRLFSLDHATFRGEGEDLHYGVARYFCQWMDQQGKLWAFYHRYRDTVSADPTGERAFEQTMGITLEQAQGTWERWLRGLQ